MADSSFMDGVRLELARMVFYSQIAESMEIQSQFTEAEEYVLENNPFYSTDGARILKPELAYTMSKSDFDYFNDILCVKELAKRGLVEEDGTLIDDKNYKKIEKDAETVFIETAIDILPTCAIEDKDKLRETLDKNYDFKQKFFELMLTGETS